MGGGEFLGAGRISRGDRRNLDLWQIDRRLHYGLGRDSRSPEYSES
jgi:hypothetical protein